MIKIMIADDQELIRESLKIILSTKEEFKVIATVGSGKEVIEAIRREQPDVILMSHWNAIRRNAFSHFRTMESESIHPRHQDCLTASIAAILREAPR